MTAFPRAPKRHTVTFHAIARNSSGIATRWIGECRCKKSWTGPDYYDVESQWTRHVREERAS